MVSGIASDLLCIYASKARRPVVIQKISRSHIALVILYSGEPLSDCVEMAYLNTILFYFEDLVLYFSVDFFVDVFIIIFDFENLALLSRVGFSEMKVSQEGINC